jgi:hypothetical protein
MAALDLERDIAGAEEFERTACTSSSCSGVPLLALKSQLATADFPTGDRFVFA